LTETIAKQDVVLDKLHDLTFYRDDLQNPTAKGQTTTFPKYHLNPFNKSTIFFMQLLSLKIVITLTLKKKNELFLKTFNFFVDETLLHESLKYFN
jgi:hypothetical protein